MEILEALQVVLILEVLTVDDLLVILIMEVLILVDLAEVVLGIIERTLLMEEWYVIFSLSSIILLLGVEIGLTETLLQVF